MYPGSRLSLWAITVFQVDFGINFELFGVQWRIVFFFSPVFCLDLPTAFFSVLALFLIFA
jgi:hypothetical protein